MLSGSLQTTILFLPFSPAKEGFFLKGCGLEAEQGKVGIWRQNDYGLLKKYFFIMGMPVLFKTVSNFWRMRSY
jgi:hypothetical protein